MSKSDIIILTVLVLASALVTLVTAGIFVEALGLL